MPDSANLALPYIAASQAQKHVTHNEALRLLDGIVQLSVKDRHLSAPPGAPAEGARYIVAAGASGAWTGWTGSIAMRADGSWFRLIPKTGWVAWVEDEGLALRWRAGAWADDSDLVMVFARLGIGAAPDATNRLSVASPATLLNHDGAGHQLKLNKAAAGDTASLLFQTGFSGRAEMGTAGSDDFSVKVSPDGVAFHTALEALGADGSVRVPAGLRLPDGVVATPGLRFESDLDTGIFHPAADQIGLATGGTQRALLSTTALQIDLPVTGTSVMSSATDATNGRLLRNFSTGCFGLGTTDAQPGPGGGSGIDDTALPTGFWRTTNAMSGTFPLGAAFLGRLRVERYSANSLFQELQANNSETIWRRRAAAGVWQAWQYQISSANLLGTVSQSGGLPTGAVIERGSNANGEYVKLADGTMICARTNLSAANASTALGSLFRSGNVTWTFPAAFIAAPAVSGGVDDSDCWLSAAAPSTTAVVVRALAGATKAGALNLRAVAVGRWF